jgi:hypothetical protein
LELEQRQADGQEGHDRSHRREEPSWMPGDHA